MIKVSYLDGAERDRWVEGSALHLDGDSLRLVRADEHARSETLLFSFNGICFKPGGSWLNGVPDQESLGLAGDEGLAIALPNGEVVVESAGLSLHPLNSAIEIVAWDWQVLADWQDGRQQWALQDGRALGRSLLVKPLAGAPVEALAGFRPGTRSRPSGLAERRSPT